MRKGYKPPTYNSFKEYITSRLWHYAGYSEVPDGLNNLERIHKIYKEYKSEFFKNNPKTSLHEYLGLTESQLNLYKENPSGLVKVILWQHYEYSRSSKKLVFVDGLPHRERRGKLVPIPIEWFGKVTYPQNIRKRPSKGIRKLR